MPPTIRPSRRLDQVSYDIRGPLSRRAHQLEREGRQILRLNIGNPGAFGFEVPAPLHEAVAAGLRASAAYCHQQGLPQVREAIAAREAMRGARAVSADTVFVGNGVSELIDMSLRALLDGGDEVLVPAPDYPLWSAAVRLNEGVPVHYPCAAADGFLPDPARVESLVGPRTRALVLINPNNPTGAVYPRPLLEALVALAQRHGLLLLADEIYDGITYEGAVATPLASLAGEAPCLSYGGLSKVHRACGYRVGWLSVSGAPAATAALRERLELLSALRLCSNVAGQWAVLPALAGDRSIEALTAPGGRLHATRQVLLEHCAASDRLDLVAPQGAMYAFPRLCMDGIDDQRFALDLLEHESVLLVPGRGFNIERSDHVRLTLLPEAPVMAEVLLRIERQLDRTAAAAAPLALSA